jgi:hypothetical protein
MNPVKDIKVVSVRPVKGVTIHYFDMQEIDMKLSVFVLVMLGYHVPDNVFYAWRAP